MVARLLGCLVRRAGVGYQDHVGFFGRLAEPLYELFFILADCVNADLRL
jgi:hypothetical protein